MKKIIREFLKGCALLALSASTASADNIIAATGPFRTTAIPFDQIGAVASKQYSGDGLAVTTTSDGATLHCVFQQLNAKVTTQGLCLFSTKNGAKGQPFRVMASALGRMKTQALLPTGSVQVDGQIARFVRPGLTEEYSVNIGGLRQDFVIEQRPDGEGPLQLQLDVDGAKAEPAPDGARLVLDNGGRRLAYNRLKAVDARGKELTAKLKALSSNRLAVVLDDSEAEYPVRIDPTFSDANWAPLGSGMNGIVYCLIVSDANIYVGGSFTVAGGISASNIAKWNGNSWSALGSGISGTFGEGTSGSSSTTGGPEVDALAVAGTNLYAGGIFSTAGGITVNGIAEWNGSTWSALGSGMDLNVTALAVSGTTLYAGGYFTSAGNVFARCIAQWNGNSWSALGSGVSGTSSDDNGPYVSALAVSGNILYVGGDFSFNDAYEEQANDIVQWTGNEWLVVGGGGISGPGRDQGAYVSALAVSGNNMYVGGDFGVIGNISANYVAEYNGISWSALGSGNGGGMNGPVMALAASGTNLYAGGSFTEAGNDPLTGKGGVAANNIALWNGNSWSALGSGMNSTVEALATSGPNLFAGGQFTTVGVTDALYIAEAAESGDSVQFTANPTNGPFPLVVQFTSPGIDSTSNSIVSWNWNFGDGSTSTLQNPSHTYTNLGTFTPTLVAINSNLNVISGIGPSVTVNFPAIQFGANPTNGIEPSAVQFTCPSVDNAGTAITRWNWNFGDGSTSTLQSPLHTYANAGSYFPSLTVTNSNGITIQASGPSVTVNLMPALTIQDPIFSTPFVGPPDIRSSYKYDPTESAWIFSGNAGISASYGLIIATPPNDLGQFAFLQGDNSLGGSMSQIISNSVSGRYAFTFQAAQANGGQIEQTVTVFMDGTNIGAFTPSESPYQWYSFQTLPAYLNAGNHTLTFSCPAITGNASIILYNVAAVYTPIISQSPATNYLYTAIGATETLSVTTAGDGINYQWFSNLSAIEGATNSSLTLANITSAMNGNNYWVIVKNQFTSESETNAEVELLVVPAVRELPYGNWPEVSPPIGYWPNVPMTYTIQAGPSSGTIDYAVQEQITGGNGSSITVSNINDGGVFDANTATINWGPFFDDSPRTLTYVLAPSSGTTNWLQFNGIISIDGNNYPVLGDDAINLLPLDPADNGGSSSRPIDNVISVDEFSAYATAWRAGSSWPVPPSPIPIQYMTSAGFIWANGGYYVYDASQGGPPNCWVSTPQPGEAQPLPASNPTNSASTIVSSMPAIYSNNVPLIVILTVTPATNTMAYVVEDQVPAGWTVTNISSAGIYSGFDSYNNEVKWGPIFSTSPVQLTYQVIPPANAANTANFAGVASFNGASIPITGTRQVSSSSAPPVFRQAVLSSKGLVLTWSAVPTLEYQLQYSTNLTSGDWVSVGGVLSGTNSTMSVTNTIGLNPQGFYRVQLVQ